MTDAPRFSMFRSTSEAASQAMRRNRWRDTKPEMLLRRAVWRLGLRYRVSVSKLPGKPDIVFTRQKVAVFCDGDFWHGKDWDSRQAKLERGSNAAYWIPKIQRNIERDKEQTARLEREGWTVIRLWESDIKNDPAKAAEAVREAVEAAQLRRTD